MHVINELKTHGYRLTKPRREIYNALASYPLSALEIYDSLKKEKVRIDLASVYRSLELFAKIGFVKMIEFGGLKRYETVDGAHHHHLVCNNCGIIKDIIINEEHFLKEVTKKSQFKVDRHNLEFFGRCTDCQ